MRRAIACAAMTMAGCGAPGASNDAAQTDADLRESAVDVGRAQDSALSVDAASEDSALAVDSSSELDASLVDGATGIDAHAIDAAATDARTFADGASPADARADAPVMAVNPLDGVGPVELVRGAFMFTEGPQWREREGDLLFSDIPANVVFRLVLPGTVSDFRRPSDNSNGLAVDTMGRLYAAEHGSRALTRARMDGTRETLASGFMEGGAMRRLNSPNDVIVRSDGTVYFTDPPYGINPATQQELSFNGVFRRTPAGALTAEWRGARTSRPNGVALSPDERTLYVADTADGRVRAWDVAADGALSRERTVATTSGNPDGMAVDRDGNLFVTTGTGVQVFSSAGRLWGTIAVPMQPANCAFGGADARTLFVTARTAVYRVRLARPGIY
jgi:gluconolactonase